MGKILYKINEGRERGERDIYIYVMTNRGTRKTYESKDGNAEGSLNNI
jgi:hypothetical protein